MLGQDENCRIFLPIPSTFSEIISTLSIFICPNRLSPCLHESFLYKTLRYLTPHYPLWTGFCISPLQDSKWNKNLLRRSEEELEYFIELKGCNVGHAIDQLRASIKQLSADVTKKAKMAFVISTKPYPLTNSTVQLAMKEFKTNLTPR